MHSSAANEAGGYIKLFRKLTEWEWYDDANTMRVFIHILLHANHKPGKWHGIEIGAGQWFTSYDRIAADLKLTKKQVRAAIERLESSGEIRKERKSKGTQITVEKWRNYQASGDPEEAPRALKGHAFSEGQSRKTEKMGTKRALKKEPKTVGISTITEKENDSEGTQRALEGHSKGIHMGTKQEEKECKEQKEIYIKDPEWEVQAIIDYLNQKTGKHFRAKTKVNAEGIRARLAEGFTLADLKQVVDDRTERWLGDEKMEQFLNPVTLFRPKNFEKYLNAKGEKTKDSEETDAWSTWV